MCCVWVFYTIHHHHHPYVHVSVGGLCIYYSLPDFELADYGGKGGLPTLVTGVERYLDLTGWSFYVSGGGRDTWVVWACTTSE